MYRDYPVATILLVAILIAGIFLVSDYVADQSERETGRYSVLHTDGSPVPDSELDWLQQAANTLAYEADDTFLQQTIQSDGLGGAFVQWTAGSFGPGAVFGSASASPAAYPLTPPMASYYLDKNGNIVLHTPTDAQVFMPFYEGLATVGVFPVDASSEILEPEFRYINREGNTLLTPDYEQVEPFSNGRAAFLVEDRWGYMDTKGNEIIPPLNQLPIPFLDAKVAVVHMAAIDDSSYHFTLTLDEAGNAISTDRE